MMANMKGQQISFSLKDPTGQLEPSSAKCKAKAEDTIQDVIQRFSVCSGSDIKHLRVHFKDLPVLFMQPSGIFTTVGDIKLQNGDVLEVSHRHGKPCRYCKRTILIKLFAENGYSCSYKIKKEDPLKTIISSFAKFSLTNIESLKLSYSGKNFRLEMADGKLTTPSDLGMGDQDKIDIVHKR